jgi:hypothetical protein
MHSLTPTGLRLRDCLSGSTLTCVKRPSRHGVGLWRQCRTRQVNGTFVVAVLDCNARSRESTEKKNQRRAQLGQQGIKRAWSMRRQASLVETRKASSEYRWRRRAFQLSTAAIAQPLQYAQPRPPLRADRRALGSCLGSQDAQGHAESYCEKREPATHDDSGCAGQTCADGSTMLFVETRMTRRGTWQGRADRSRPGAGRLFRRSVPCRRSAVTVGETKELPIQCRSAEAEIPAPTAGAWSACSA